MSKTKGEAHYVFCVSKIPRAKGEWMPSHLICVLGTDLQSHLEGSHCLFSVLVSSRVTLLGCLLKTETMSFSFVTALDKS